MAMILQFQIADECRSGHASHWKIRIHRAQCRAVGCAPEDGSRWGQPVARYPG